MTNMTRRMLFMRLLGLLGTGVLVSRVLAFSGWKEIPTPEGNSWQGTYWERIVGTQPHWLDTEYVLEKVENLWHDKRWKYVCFDRVLSTDSEALGKDFCWIGHQEEAEFLTWTKAMLRQGAECTVGHIVGAADSTGGSPWTNSNN